MPTPPSPDDAPLRDRDVFERIRKEIDPLVEDAIVVLNVQGIKSNDPRRETALAARAVRFGLYEETVSRLGGKDNLSHFLEQYVDFGTALKRQLHELAKRQQITKGDIDRIFASTRLGMNEGDLLPLSPEGVKHFSTHLKDLACWTAANLRDSSGQPLSGAKPHDIAESFRACLRHSWEKSQRPIVHFMIFVEVCTLILMATHGFVSQTKPSLGVSMLAVGVVVNAFFILGRRNIIM